MMMGRVQLLVSSHRSCFSFTVCARLVVLRVYRVLKSTHIDRQNVIRPSIVRVKTLVQSLHTKAIVCHSEHIIIIS